MKNDRPNRSDRHCPLNRRVTKRRVLFDGFLALGCALLLLTTGLAAQDHTSPQTKPAVGNSAPTPGVVFAPDEEYRIGPSDELSIQIEDAPQLSGNRRVSASGHIALPYLKKVEVLNKTTEEVAATIADGLRGRYLKDPQVSVAVLRPTSHMFTIQGAVRYPGIYYIEGRPTLVKLISSAGGLAENYGSTAFILRESKPETEGSASSPLHGSGGPAGSLQTVAENRPTSPPAAGEAEAENAGYEIIPVNIARFLKGVVGNASLYIKPGDIVNVPPTDVFFVAGEVRKPGDFPLKDGTTLRQALSLAQGTNFEAALGRAVIFREDGGKRIEIPIDISAIMTNKKPDVSIMPNDVIMVPNSRAKSITGAFLRAFGSNAAHMPIP